MDFIPISQPSLGDEEAAAVYNQVKGGWISMGETVKKFERMIASYLDVKHVVAFNNGTSSLHAALAAVGAREDDEVIVPCLSYISSANVIYFCRAKPVFVEENPKTFTVDADEIEKKITSKTKAIMVVDLKGMPVDYDAVEKISQKHGVRVIADSAESFGAKYKGRLVGSQTEVHSFSMFANKNITTGEGGFVSTNNDQIADFCRCFRNQGQSKRYLHVMIGQNYRMTDILAALGIEQLKRIEQIMKENNKIAAKYNRAFKDHGLIHPPYIPSYVSRHSWYMYCLSFDDSIDRDRIIKHLAKNGVDHRLSFPPIPLQPIYKELYGYKNADYPRAKRIFDSFLDIPCWAGMRDAQIQKVINVIMEAVNRSSH